MRIAKVGPCRSLPVDALRTGVVPDTGLDPTPVVTLHSNRAVYLNVNHYGTKEILNWTSFSPAGSNQLIFLFVLETCRSSIVGVRAYFLSFRFH